MDTTINVYTAYAPATTESVGIRLDPTQVYECHFYVPGDSYDRCEELIGTEIAALPSATRHHHTPSPVAKVG